MAVTLADHVAQIKSKVYANSQTPSELIDQIFADVTALDRLNAGSEHIQPLADEVIHLIWNLYGCPEAEHDWPVPPPPPEPEPEPEDETGVDEKRRKRRS